MRVAMISGIFPLLFTTKPSANGQLDRLLGGLVMVACKDERPAQGGLIGLTKGNKKAAHMDGLF